MTGALRVTRVPYDSEHADYDYAIDLLDEHSGSYPLYGKAQVKRQ